MDPFDELARLTASGASGGHTSQQRLSTNSHQQSSGDLAPASQFTPNMSALPVTARGNPFVDTPPKAKTAPARARAVPSGVFQDLLPTDFSGVNSSVSPMRGAIQTLSDPAAPASNYSPLAQSLQVAFEGSFAGAANDTSASQLCSGSQGWDAFGEAAFQAPAHTSSPVVVDGLDRHQVDLLFQQADWNQDGRLVNNEAKHFFKRTRLADDTLFMLWEKTKALSPAPREGLTREQFSVALRLIAVAQTGRPLTSDLLDQAADPQQWQALHGTPLPPPHLQPDKPSKEHLAGGQSPTSQLQPLPKQQLQTQAQQQAPQAAGLDPFADSQTVELSTQTAAQAEQQQQGLSEAGHNLYADPFDGVSQPFMQGQQPAGPAGGSPKGGHGDNQFGVGVNLHEQPLLFAASAPQANPFDESSQPFMPKQPPSAGGGRMTGGHGTPHSQLMLHEQPPLLSASAPESQQSPLDDMLMPPPPPRPPRPLQHYQSMPKGAGPRPKSSLQRYTDIPTHAAPIHVSSSQTHLPTASSHDSPTAVSASAPSALPVLANPFAQSSFGDMALARPSAPVLRVQRADMSPTGSPSSSPVKGRPEGRADAPLALDARLPPLHSKLSAQLTMLAAGHGSVFAGPSSGGFGLLQWARPEGNMRQPKGANSSEDRAQRSSGAVLANAEEGRWTAGREDSDAAASVEVPIHDCKKPTCIHVDEIAGILWTGHNDGKICAFALDAKPGVALTGRTLNSWQAHRIGSVTVLLTTPWGELWSGSSRGIIRVWRNAHKSGGEGQRAVRELRRPGGGKPHGQVRSMTVAAGGQVVWSGGDKSTCLWCAYSGHFLGTIDRGREMGLPESSSFTRDSLSRPLVDDWKAKVDTSKGLELDGTGRIYLRPKGGDLQQIWAEQEAWGASSEKATHAFLENLAVTGARAAGNAGKAAKYIGKLGGKLARNFASNDPRPVSFSTSRAPDEEAAGGDRKGHHLRALVAAHDGSVWVAFKAGRIERYKFNARLVWSKETGTGIASMASIGPNIWVGLADGRVRVYKDAGQQDFQAHEAGIIAIVPCGTRAFTLAADGSLKGWDAHAPSPLDAVARASYEEGAAALVSRANLEMLCLTWNVNEQRPEGSPLFSWIADLSGKASIAVVALQEIEMGSSSVAIAAAKDVLNKSAQEKGNNNAQWWQSQVLNSLGAERWMRVGLRQLSGMLVMVFALSSLSANVGEVSTASVACGVLGVGGNKGGVAVSFTLYRRRLCCVSSHFAAHQGAVEARNRDYANIVRSLNFVSKGWYDTQVMSDDDADTRRKEMTKLSENDSGLDSPRADSEYDLASSEFSTPELVQGQGMRDAEMLVWAGDFNYRIEATYEDALDHIRNNELDYLIERDQCRREMYAGHAFRYVREAPITFCPTYKFDKHTPDPLGYDSSEKRRVPAWTDRIFFRGSAFIKNASEDDVSVRSAESEDSALTPPPQAAVDEVVVKALKYSACVDVIDSDHKPVWALLALEVPVTNQEKKRRMCSHILKQTANQGQALERPALQVSCDNVQLNQDGRRPTKVTLTNVGSQAGTFCMVHQASRQWWGQPDGFDAGLPDWLDAFPLHGCLAPQESVDVQLAAITNDNVYTSQAMEAQLFFRVGTELVAGAEQQLDDSSNLLPIHVSCQRHF